LLIVIVGANRLPKKRLLTAARAARKIVLKLVDPGGCER
jgi:hypothetical protein